MLTADELQAAIESARRDLLAAVADMHMTQLYVRPTPNDWAAIEVLAHLPETDYFYLQQALMGRNELVHGLAYFDEVRWKAENAIVERLDYTEIQRRLSASHRSVLTVLSGFGPAELDRPVAHRKGIPYTVGDVFGRLPQHDRAHISQLVVIRKIIAAR